MQKEREMTQAITLTRIGNSKAVIIPAKILKSLKITENTILNLSDDNECITISRSGSVRAEPIFPKVKLSEPTGQEIDAFMASLYAVPAEDIANDERLAYILNK